MNPRSGRGHSGHHEMGAGRGHGKGPFDSEAHGHGRGRGGPMGRLFAHGNLHFAILALIEEKPRHGYELIKVIEEMVGGAYSPSPGTIYPALSMLEDASYVTVEANESGKKLYTVTESGKAYLEENRSTVDALLARLKQAGVQERREAAPQIIRAMENLKVALRLKLAGDPLNAEQVRAVAQALDNAVAEIERL